MDYNPNSGGLLHSRLAKEISWKFRLNNEYRILNIEYQSKEITKFRFNNGGFLYNSSFLVRYSSFGLLKSLSLTAMGFTGKLYQIPEKRREPCAYLF